MDALSAVLSTLQWFAGTDVPLVKQLFMLCYFRQAIAQAHTIIVVEAYVARHIL
jgi:hypothetical protein